MQFTEKGRFTDKEYEKLYPSDPIAPRMYGTVKAHKPEKNYPMRIVVSTIGTANYGISDYLVKIAQNTLNKNPNRVKNTQTFVEEAKTWEIGKDEVQVSYDVVNLYPSIPVKEATDVLVDQLSKDEEFRTVTKLTIPEVKAMIDLCLSKCYFIWNDEIHELENSGPIGLSLMVSMAESYLQFLEGKAINIAMREQIVVKSFKRYVDDSHSRFNELESAEKFQGILNQQDHRIQYTMEVENEEKSLNYLEVKTINTGKGKYEFDIYRKKAITNVQVKPNSNHDPRILKGIFKGFVHRAFKICSEGYLDQEIEFLISVFKENGYEENQLRRTIKEVKDKFSRDSEEQEGTEGGDSPTVTLPWIPGISPKLKKVYKIAGYKAVFKSGPNLQTLLTSKNKTRLPRNSHPGIYKLPCICDSVPPYIGETKLQIRTRGGKHEEYVRKEQWDQSGAALHQRDCKSGFADITTIKVESRKFDREVRENLEIQKHGSGPKEGGINQDDGKHVKTSFWIPMMRYLHRREEKNRERHARTTNGS